MSMLTIKLIVTEALLTHIRAHVHKLARRELGTFPTDPDRYPWHAVEP